MFVRIYALTVQMIVRGSSSLFLFLCGVNQYVYVFRICMVYYAIWSEASCFLFFFIANLDSYTVGYSYIRQKWNGETGDVATRKVRHICSCMRICAYAHAHAGIFPNKVFIMILTGNGCQNYIFNMRTWWQQSLWSWKLRCMGGIYQMTNGIVHFRMTHEITILV